MKKGKYFFASTVVVFVILFFSISAFSQKESVVYLGKNGKLTTLDHAEIMQKIFRKSASSATVQSLKLLDSKWEKVYSEKYRAINDSTFKIKSSGEGQSTTFDRTYQTLPNGSFRFKEVHKGKVVREGYSITKIPLTLHGQVTEYYKIGQKKSISEYQNNELVSNQNWYESGEKYLDNIFYSVDNEPSFVPGMKVLHQHILKGFKEAGIDIASVSGSMIIGFVVTENGKIDGLKIIKGIEPSINSAALESFANLIGEWIPAKLNNRNVRYFQVFPINFIYNAQSFEFAEMRKGILHWGAF